MPPKKKGKKGKKGKKKKSGGALDDGDKLKVANHEIDSLKDQLAYRKEYVRKAKVAYEEIKERLEDTEEQIDKIESSHKSANAYLTHQYKSLQTDTSIKMHQLESEYIITKKQLEATESALKQANEEKKRLRIEKDEKIAELEQKIASIQITYDSIIHSTLDSFIENLNRRKAQWENNSVKLQTKNKTLLAELGLKIHDI